jgi:O-antigen ligase
LQLFFQDEFVLFLALAGVITSAAACRRFLAAATAGMCGVVTFALLSGGNSSFGRFGIEGSKFANPNDFSFHLIFLGCFVICFLVTKRVSIVASALALVGLGFLGLATVQFFRAGSRGGLIVLVALSALGWFRLQSNKKVVILVAAVAGVLMAPLVLPSTALARYSTIFGDDSNVTTAGEAQDVMVAEASSDARKATLWQSVDLTREHPIVGVGPGEFADVMEKKFKAMSRFRIYTGTHNSYTQISSEMGIPGLFFFVAILWTSYRSLKKTREITRGKPDLAVVHNMAWAVTFALLAFVIGSLFVHYGFTTYMPMVAALSVGLAQAADNTVQTT